MGRGSSGADSGAGLSSEMKERYRAGISARSSDGLDRVQAGLERDIAKEQDVVSNLKTYVRIGYIKSAKDEWFQRHVRSLKNLKAQLAYFKAERRRQGK